MNHMFLGCYCCNYKEVKEGITHLPDFVPGGELKTKEKDGLDPCMRGKAAFRRGP
jgi:hypothetical protein